MHHSHNTYLGGLVERDEFERLRSLSSNGSAGIEARNDDFIRNTFDDKSLFLNVNGELFAQTTFGSVSVMIRGFAKIIDQQTEMSINHVARFIYSEYQETGELPVDSLDGSFTIALLDSDAGRVMLYRNLVGTGFTYYSESSCGLLFSSNLSCLVDSLQSAPLPNDDVLPAFFLFRTVPGRETLFNGIYRLMPGEMIVYENNVFSRSQRTTFRTLEQTEKIDADAMERLENTMGEILDDYARFRPNAVNLLSGGVDSSYIQGHWNRTTAHHGRSPVSYCAHIEHPDTRLDTEYALSAANAMRTRLRVITLNEPYSRYLFEMISQTAEMPNHVQSTYFLPLAHKMVDDGFSIGICGEGADSLFGVGDLPVIQYAEIFRKILPFHFGRKIATRLALAVRRNTISRSLQVADYLYDYKCIEHPINHVAVFTHWDSVQKCFGHNAVDRGLRDRRNLLDQYSVPEDPAECLHAVGFLGEGMDTAALWTTLFNTAGGDLLCPFLDSRMLKFALNLVHHKRFPFRQPKGLLKKALARHISPELVYRRKLGFGQPIFEWMSQGGQLRELVENISSYPFMRKRVFEQALSQPNWFLYSLLCYDTWHKMFIERSIPRDWNGEVGSLMQHNSL